jgi:hypothetical protein
MNRSTRCRAQFLQAYAVRFWGTGGGGGFLARLGGGGGGARFVRAAAELPVEVAGETDASP